MNPFDLITFPDPTALAEGVAADWLALTTEAGQGAGFQLVALSGGRIANGFLAAAATQAKALGVTFATTQFFWADERCVSPDDPESNYGLVRRHLLGPLAVPEQHIHRIRGEIPANRAAGEAEERMRRLAASDEQGQPMLDLVVLGMGEDGHIASLFPGEPEEVMANPAVYRAVMASKPPPQRITLGYPALRAARQVWVLVSGAGKEPALRESLSVTGATPLARVIRERKRTRILVSQNDSPGSK